LAAVATGAANLAEAFGGELSVGVKHEVLVAVVVDAVVKTRGADFLRDFLTWFSVRALARDFDGSAVAYIAFLRRDGESLLSFWEIGEGGNAPFVISTTCLDESRSYAEESCERK
jgi:hypothetical protein